MSAAALYFARRAHVLKHGHRIRGAYSITSTIDCNDKYVSNVTLENAKDRAVVIYGVYLQVGASNWVVLEEFRDEPLILRAFEAWQGKYGPIEHYVGGGGGRVDINGLLDSKRVRKRLVLATSEGRHVVREWVRHWWPVTLFFRNHLTGVLHPVRPSFEGAAYGSNVRYLVRLTTVTGQTETVPLRIRDHSFRQFREFGLTPEALRSREALEEFLLARAVEGTLPCRDVTVVDLDHYRADAFERERKTEPFTLPPINWFMYHVVGRAYTWWSNAKSRRANRKLARLAKSRGALPAPTTSALPESAPEIEPSNPGMKSDGAADGPVAG